MIKNTVKRIGDDLEKLANKRIPLATSFKLLEQRASTVEELVVIEVMREALNEHLASQEHLIAS